MVPNKPRFGGGNSMEQHNDKQHTGAPKMERPVGMEDTLCEHMSGAQPGLPAFRMEEKGNWSHRSGEDGKIRNSNGSAMSIVEDPWSASDVAASTLDGARDSFRDLSSVTNCVIEKINGHDLASCSSKRSEHDQGQDRDDGVFNKTALLISARKNEVDDVAGGLKIDDDTSQSDAFSTLPAQEDLVRLTGLLKVFKTLGIQAHLSVYSRLTDQDKQHWSSVFQEILSNAFCGSSPPIEDGGSVVYCKNLFLKDRKGQYYIVVADDAYKVDLKKLKQQMNAARNLSFATVDDLANILQVKPGEVTPFTIMQESAKHVRVALHESLTNVQESHKIKMAFHPFTPLLQTEIFYSELVSFMKYQGKELEVLGENRSNMCTILANPHMGDNTKDSADPRNDEDISCVATTRLSRASKLHYSDRKGKLKSYVTKNTSHNDTDSKTVKNKPKKKEDGELNENESKAGVERVNEEGTTGLVNAGTTYNEDEARYNEMLASKSTPQINEFYESLRCYQIAYREISVSSATSEDIGPALGARCFLMKDRRDNYYIIVSHEFYELDYGRLKRALHPKKKLDECGVDCLPLILGVDRQHFTPFAVMNARTRNSNNKVHVFFTQKIVSDHVILCLQHPFGPGRRILMTSSELRRLLGEYSCNKDVGVVEEKPWPRKYNTAFSQFDIARPEATYPPVSTSIHHASHAHSTGNQQGSSLSKTALYTDVKSYTRPSNIDDAGENVNKWNYVNESRLMMNRISNTFCGIFRDWRHSQINRLWSHDANTDGSSVDPQVLTKTWRHDTAPSPQIRRGPDRLSPRSLAGKDDCLHLVDKNDGHISSTKNETKSTRLSKDPPISDNNKPFGINYNAVISANDITAHLDLHDVSYQFRYGHDGTGNDILCLDYDDESMSQECHTLHLSDASGTQHYLIVGRDSEHVSVKRFRRRFQIESRLFIVNELDEETPDGETVRTIATTNPFAVLVSTKTGRVPHVAGGEKVKVKHELVLFSSIYMDPDMTCIFEMDDNSACLCITSQELENYAKRVGMEVRYMP